MQYNCHYELQFAVYMIQKRPDDWQIPMNHNQTLTLVKWIGFPVCYYCVHISKLSLVSTVPVELKTDCKRKKKKKETAEKVQNNPKKEKIKTKNFQMNPFSRMTMQLSRWVTELVKWAVYYGQPLKINSVLLHKTLREKGEADWGLVWSQWQT